MVLHVEPAWGVVVPDDLVHALTEFRVGIGVESGAHTLIAGFEGISTVLAQIVAASRDAEMHPIAVSNDRVHAESTIAGLPLTSVLMVADAGHHFPRITAVCAPEQRRRLHAAQEFVSGRTRFER